MEPLIVPGRLDSLEKIRKFILLAADHAGLEKARSYKLSLAVDEIATNIINYGYTEAGVEGDISVEAEMDEQALTIKLDDTSGYYDPSSKSLPPEENFSQPLGERAIGGWGVYLAIRSVDQFQYQRLKDHNHNIFVMYRNAHGDG
jgi:anti-sigma regulatory factor (Ser/Thr protein kinase)